MIREIIYNDYVGLMNLYTHLHNNYFPEDSNLFFTLWEQIINDKNHHIIVAIEDDKIVSSCVCIIVPNLTHNQQPYAFIENVVTLKEYRNRGLATSCLNYAKELAVKENCYKLMLLTGSKDNATLNFYRKAGYNSEDKTAFIQWL